MEKVIKDFPDYTVSDSGNVYSYQHKKKHLLKGFVTRNGYVYVDLCKDGYKERKAVHRLVGQYFLEGYFEGAVINHKDCNTQNNNAENLEWVSQKENVHFSYDASGVGATRNYRRYKLVYPDGKQSPEFIGFLNLQKYLIENNINIAFTSLQKYGKTGEYKILKY